MKDDEEQRAKLQDICDLLLAAGYFRVRVKGLSAFDKVSCFYIPLNIFVFITTLTFLFSYLLRWLEASSGALSYVLLMWMSISSFVKTSILEKRCEFHLSLKKWKVN